MFHLLSLLSSFRSHTGHTRIFKRRILVSIKSYAVQDWKKLWTR